MNMHFPEPDESSPRLPEPSGAPSPEVDSFYRRPLHAGSEPTGVPQVSNGGHAL
jgi:hypothetical protein